MSLIAPLTLDTPDTLYSKSYAIIVTETTSQNTEWQRVVEYLLLKHSQASLIVYKDNDFLQLRDQLRQLSNLPKYTCFICQPTECGRNFIATIHRLLRTLDTFTPYLDTMWSIVTGSDASLALESVKTTNTSDELIITKGLNFTYVNQDLFEACFTFGDDRNGHWYSKLFGEERSGDEYPKHPATLWCEMFNDIQPDLLVTSGHGNQYSLELPFSNGVLCPVADTSCLCAINNLKEKKLLHDPISSSPNPKVFLPIGNCLMGFCCGSNCMVTLFMGKLGVKQLCGYTVSTWFGRGGWDVLKKWTAIPGRHTLTESYFFNQIHMINDIKEYNEDLLKFNLNFTCEDYDCCYNPEQIKIYTKCSTLSNDICGLLYDRDIVACYGDPAFVARFKTIKETVETHFECTGENQHRFVITFINDIVDVGPIGSVFTYRIKDYKLLTDNKELKIILSHNFIFVINPKPKDNEKILKIDFQGTIIKSN